MKKKLLIAALAACALGAFGTANAAGGFGAGVIAIGGEASGYVGSGGGYAESATVGGSNATGKVNGTGFLVQHTSNNGAAYSGAGAAVNNNGVVTYTVGGSHSTNLSAGYTAGQAQGTTAGGVGSDYSSEAWGAFETGAIGGSLIIGGFGAFEAFTW